MSRLYIICFDVADKRRLREVADALENYGARVQYSVFECYLDATKLNALQQIIAALIDPEADHVRYYQLCLKDRNGILIDGKGQLSPDNSFHLY
jgi:CRISPR-associated protein Cas2